MNESFDIKKVRSEIHQFVEARDWDQFHTMKNLTMALNVESSELLEIFQWMKEDDAHKVSEDPKLHEKVKDEVGDILFYLIRFAHKANIDLETALLEKLKKSALKYPAEKVRGSAKKYNEYE